MLHVVHDDENFVHVAADDDFAHCDDVGVLALQESVDFTEGGDGEALFFLFHLETFQGDDFFGAFVASAIDNAISAFFYAV